MRYTARKKEREGDEGREVDRRRGCIVDDVPLRM
jgi:hypothetical protein